MNIQFALHWLYIDLYIDISYHCRLFMQNGGHLEKGCHFEFSDGYFTVRDDSSSF